MPKKKSHSENVAKLVNIPRFLWERIESKMKREKDQLKARRAGTFTSLTNALHEAWVEGRINPWNK